MNDYQFKLVKFRGEFVWHDHQDTDEVFVVLGGEMEIEFRDSVVRVAPQKECYGVGDILPNPFLVAPFEISHEPDAFPPPLTTRLIKSAVIATFK